LADDVYSTQSATFQLKDGGFAIAYQDADVVKYISFTATGNINKTTTVFDAGSDTIYDVAATQLRGGNIVVVYEYETSTGPSQLMGHIITPDGTPVSGPTMLSDINTGTYNEYPDVAATADGGFVVVWNHDDTDDIGYMRRFDAAMVPFGASERVSNSTNPDEEDFKVAIAPDGSMLVTWNDGQADELRTQAYAVEHVASPFDDNLKGTNAADTIDLGAGNDTYDGMGGDDVMNGGDGNDDMRGSQGNDTMNGDGDEDKMLGGKGDDTMYGGDGNDTMKGKSGDDTMYGGDGNDTMNGSKGNDTMYGGAGEDIMKGSIGVDKMYGDADNDDMKGNAGNDKMYGGLGDDTMKGGKGNDTMYGGDKPNTPEGDIKDGGDIMEGANGNDTIYGGAGGDKITGGKGNDVMTGGDGKDTFIFKAKHGQDTITDFNLKQDDIEIRAYLINQHVAAKQVGSDTVLEYGAAYDHDGKASTDKIYSQVTFEDMNLTKTLQELGITQADLDPFLM
jgi:Ca2+-binding RTX toxin-like protein